MSLKRRFSLFDTKRQWPTALRAVHERQADEDVDLLHHDHTPQIEHPATPVTSTTPPSASSSRCSVCLQDYQVPYREHVKSALHQHNLRRVTIDNLPPIAHDDLGTDDPSDEAPVSGPPRSRALQRHASVRVIGDDGFQYRLQPCLVLHRVAADARDATLLRQLPALFRRHAVLLAHGGKFAAAIFDGDCPIVHTTRSRYTVRRKQGGSQAACDQRKTVRSAGAQIRRQMWTMLQEDVQQVLRKWAAEIAQCSVILVWAPSRNRTLLVRGAREQPSASDTRFSASDPRLLDVPLTVGRVTYESVKAVQEKLFTVVKSVVAAADESDDSSETPSSSDEEESAEESGAPPPICEYRQLHEMLPRAPLNAIMRVFEAFLASNDEEENRLFLMEPPLYVCARERRFNVLDELLARLLDEDIDEVVAFILDAPIGEFNYGTLLHYAASISDERPMLLFDLLACGADVSVRDEKHRTFYEHIPRDNIPLRDAVRVMAAGDEALQAIGVVPLSADDAQERAARRIDGECDRAQAVREKQLAAAPEASVRAARMSLLPLPFAPQCERCGTTLPRSFVPYRMDAYLLLCSLRCVRAVAEQRHDLF